MFFNYSTSGDYGSVNHKLFDRMLGRAAQAKTETDTDYFLSLTYLGELLLKYTALSVVTSLVNDSNRTKYSLQCQIVRADGLGDWVKTMEEVLVGPSHHLIITEFQDVIRDLNTPQPKSNWVYESINHIRECLATINEEVEPLPNKIALRTWFSQFARLRNKTRAHGALRSETISKLCPLLEQSLLPIISNFSLMKVDCVYLSRNMSGKYRTSHVTRATDRFDNLKTSEGLKYNYEDGLYLFVGDLVKLDLVYTDFDSTDFFVPNGGFTKKTFEVLSYLTGNKEKKDNSSYLIPPNELPGSETDGAKNLNVIGNCFTNIPQSRTLYIERLALEKELQDLLLDERHPVITLFGRGGIGKTTVALKVLSELCHSNRYELILWFSARDIDLLEEGVKQVKPQVVGITEISKLFVRLVDVTKFNTKGFDARKFIESQLYKSDNGAMLIVVDNFETVENPIEVFKWLDTHIRHPNKILITSRIKDSKGDYPINVTGMTKNEFNTLVDKSSETLRIESLITKEFRDQLFQESGGHPYITKIMLGEVAFEKKIGSVKRIAAGQDEVLTALFERTYNMLSPGAKLVFLTLSSWRTMVPSIAVEAILKTKSSEYYEISEAIEELFSFSFVDRIIGGKEDEYLSLPLAAYLFGQKKLTVSPLKHQTSELVWYLNFFGVSHLHNIQKGLHAKFAVFFRNVAKYLSSNKSAKISEFIPIFEYLCHRYPQTWRTLSLLYEENELIKEAIDASRNFIQYMESEEDQLTTWERIANLSGRINQHHEEAHALVEVTSMKNCPKETIMTNAARIHALIRGKKLENNFERKAILNTLISNIEGAAEKETLSLNEAVTLGWLYYNVNKTKEARKLVDRLLPSYPHSPQIHTLRNKLLERN